MYIYLQVIFTATLFVLLFLPENICVITGTVDLDCVVQEQQTSGRKLDDKTSVSPALATISATGTIAADTPNSTIELKKQITTPLKLKHEARQAGTNYEEELSKLIQQLKSSQSHMVNCDVQNFIAVQPNEKIELDNKDGVEMYLVRHKDNDKVHYMGQYFFVDSLNEQKLNGIRQSIKVESKFATKPVCVGMGTGPYTNPNPSIKSSGKKKSAIKPSRKAKKPTDVTDVQQGAKSVNDRIVNKKYFLMVMEYAIGATLEQFIDWLEKRRNHKELLKDKSADFTVKDIKAIGAQLLLAIEAQPEGMDFPRADNIRIDMDGNFQLANYILKKPSFHLTDKTDPKIVNYSPPEMADCKDPECKHLSTMAVNIFAIGLIMCQLHKGQLPFSFSQHQSYVESRQLLTRYSADSASAQIDDKEFRDIIHKIVVEPEVNRRKYTWKELKGHPFFKWNIRTNQPPFWKHIINQTYRMRYIPKSGNKGVEFEDTGSHNLEHPATFGGTDTEKLPPPHRMDTL
ncbi:protein kinase domain-containing protein [Ditylenchus destructor]|uniref:Protein kinase domain-containing protein n=1 Tax=Ditylenchus destructor TaxID=166010 RepID=A0AAD4R415_9BILA|nr:protein kinase domain-containing protein [Ditylenchus destructor]